MTWSDWEAARESATARESDDGSEDGFASGSRSLRAAETDPSVAERDVAVSRDHEVVEEVDVQEPTGCERLGS
jgi:hypothetical protein